MCRKSDFHGQLFKKILVFVVLPGIFLGVLFVAGFLQEFASDDLGRAAVGAGTSLPLRDPWIEINVQKMSLSLMDGEILVKRYDVGYGAGPPGRIVDRGDSTPLGEYEIIQKRKRKDFLARGSRFMLLDYPSLDDAFQALDVGEITADDYHAIEEAHDMGVPPPVPKTMGGPVGIQGNYFFFLDRRFTDGSVALSNGDLNELYEHVYVGTRVVIVSH